MQLTDEQYADWMDSQLKNMHELQEIARSAVKMGGSIMDDAYFIRIAAIEIRAHKHNNAVDAIDSAEVLLTELKRRGY